MTMRHTVTMRFRDDHAEACSDATTQFKSDLEEVYNANELNDVEVGETGENIVGSFNCVGSLNILMREFYRADFGVNLSTRYVLLSIVSENV